MDNGSNLENSIELIFCTMIFVILISIRAYRLGDIERIKNWVRRTLLRPAIIWGCFSGFLTPFISIFLLLVFFGEFEAKGIFSGITDFFSTFSPILLCIISPVNIMIGFLGGKVGEKFALRKRNDSLDYSRQSLYGAIGGGVAGLTIGGLIMMFMLMAG